MNQKDENELNVNSIDDKARSIHEVLQQLGWDAESETIVERIRQLDQGLPAEDEFTALCGWFGEARLIRKLNQHQMPPHSRKIYQVPDLLVHFDSAGPLLVEVKVKQKQTLSLRPD